MSSLPEPPHDTLRRPLHDLRISVTDRCNFRCVYCMPKDVFGRDHAFLPRADLLTFEEIERAARLFAGLGVVKIRLTGGEPLVRRDLEQLVAMLARLPGIELTLTTNGSLLAEKAQVLRQAGLQRGHSQPGRHRRRNVHENERRRFPRGAACWKGSRPPSPPA